MTLFHTVDQNESTRFDYDTTLQAELKFQDKLFLTLIITSTKINLISLDQLVKLEAMDKLKKGPNKILLVNKSYIDVIGYVTLEVAH